MNKFLASFLSTSNTLAPVIARVFLGFVMLPHGLQKTLGMFGGHGLSGTLGFFTGTLGIPWFVALLVILGESLGSLMLITGTLTRFAAGSLILIMLGAIFMGHLQHGFFMNWFGNQQGEGFEYHLLVIGLALSLVASGAGRWSVDSLIKARLKH